MEEQAPRETYIPPKKSFPPKSASATDSAEDEGAVARADPTLRPSTAVAGIIVPAPLAVVPLTFVGKESRPGTVCSFIVGPLIRWQN